MARRPSLAETRQPSENELAGARYHGKTATEAAKRLFAQSDCQGEAWPHAEERPGNGFES